MVIPSNAVGRVLRAMGAIKEVSGAHLEFEKAEDGKKRSADRSLVIK